LGRCDALIAVIGPKWIGDRPGGRARIWDEDDWVRLEIESALRMPIPVIPVLIDRTPMPRPDQLPESLHPLVFLQAAQMDTQRDFNTHIERLIRRLDELVTSSELEGDNGVSPNTRSPRITGNGKRSKLNFEEHVESTQPGVWGRRPTRIALLLVSVISVSAVLIILWQHKSFFGVSQVNGTTCLQWVAAKDGIVPSNPIVGGQEPSWPLYVCRTTLLGDILPGKLIRGWACYVASNGGEVASHEYDALTGRDCPTTWENAPSGVIPGNAVQGGTETGQPVFICRANHTEGTGGIQIGRSGWSTNHQCIISYGGKSFSYDTFQILTRQYQ
jgi:hypothetical protein